MRQAWKATWISLLCATSIFGGVVHLDLSVGFRLELLTRKALSSIAKDEWQPPKNRVKAQRRPAIEIIKHSPQLVFGGSALIIFRLDFQPQSLFVECSTLVEKSDRYVVFSYRETGVYLALFAWNIYHTNIAPKIVATDQNGNYFEKSIPIIQKRYTYFTDNITIPETKPDTNQVADPEALTEYTRLQRALNTPPKIYILAETAKVKPAVVSNLEIFAFEPLKNPKISGNFADYRVFWYKGKVERTSYHFGIDLYNYTNAPIECRNSGRVLFSGFNGAAGNIMVIEHFLGLFSVYMHCSELYFETGDFVPARSLIALTGKTGYSFGDHLHFAISLSGRYINPAEWMDQLWVERNIIEVLDSLPQ